MVRGQKTLHTVQTRPFNENKGAFFAKVAQIYTG
jgi:hypothetical protein